MRSTLALLALVACGPGDRASEPDALPPGVWEPAPGPGVDEASMASRAGEVWWSFTRSTTRTVGIYHDQIVDSHVGISATSSSGESLLAATVVDPQGIGYESAIAVSNAGVIVAMLADDPDLLTRAYDPTGAPLDGSPHTVRPAGYGARLTNVTLAARGVGLPRVVAAFDDDTEATTEVALIDLDDAGDAASITLLGDADDGSPYGLTATSNSDGSTVVAWDRIYEECAGPRPATTQATSVTGTSVDAIVRVRDTPERSEARPAIAGSGDTLYLAWQTDFYYDRSQISLSRYPDVTNVLAVLGDESEYNIVPAIALAEPGRGALLWLAVKQRALFVVPFEDSGSTIAVGTPREISAIGNPEAGIWPVGIVHIAEDRYVLGWTEGSSTTGRLYAIELDLGREPRHLATRTPTSAAGTRILPPDAPLDAYRCSH